MSDSVRVESSFRLYILAQTALSAFSTGFRAGGLRRPLRHAKEDFVTVSDSAGSGDAGSSAFMSLLFGWPEDSNCAACCGKRRKTPSPTATR